MKKRLFAAALALLSLVPAVASTKNTFKPNTISALGVHIGAGDGFYLGVQGHYNFDYPIRLEGRVSIMPNILPDNLTFAVNGHYLFPMNQFVTFYPIVGVEAGIGRRNSGLGVSLGGGAQFELANQIFLNTELTGLIGNYSAARLHVGLNYRF